MGPVLSAIHVEHISLNEHLNKTKSYIVHDYLRVNKASKAKLYFHIVRTHQVN